MVVLDKRKLLQSQMPLHYWLLATESMHHLHLHLKKKANGINQSEFARFPFGKGMKGILKDLSCQDLLLHSATVDCQNFPTAQWKVTGRFHESGGAAAPVFLC